MDERLMLSIRERAYEIWATTGGDAEENWLRAEAELLKNSNCEAGQKEEAPKGLSSPKQSVAHAGRLRSLAVFSAVVSSGTPLLSSSCGPLPHKSSAAERSEQLHRLNPLGLAMNLAVVLTFCGIPQIKNLRLSHNEIPASTSSRAALLYS